MIREFADIYRGVMDDPRILYREPAVALVAVIPVIALLVVWLIVWGIQTHVRQGALVRSGVCEAVREALYTPSGYMQCMSYNKDGACQFQQWVQPNPYMRTLWQCPDETFWRRSGS